MDSREIGDRERRSHFDVIDSKSPDTMEQKANLEYRICQATGLEVEFVEGGNLNIVRDHNPGNREAGYPDLWNRIQTVEGLGDEIFEFRRRLNESGVKLKAIPIRWKEGERASEETVGRVVGRIERKGYSLPADLEEVNLPSGFLQDEFANETTPGTTAQDSAVVRNGIVRTETLRTGLDVIDDIIRLVRAQSRSNEPVLFDKTGGIISKVQVDSEHNRDLYRLRLELLMFVREGFEIPKNLLTPEQPVGETKDKGVYSRGIKMLRELHHLLNDGFQIKMPLKFDATGNVEQPHRDFVELGKERRDRISSLIGQIYHLQQNFGFVIPTDPREYIDDDE